MLQRSLSCQPMGLYWLLKLSYPVGQVNYCMIQNNISHAMVQNEVSMMLMTTKLVKTLAKNTIFIGLLNKLLGFLSADLNIQETIL